ncbi:hypothetical protein MOX02_00540 [Methylobacterium oxalidis]|uniref:Uncharacterized protein n=1 Tax=Methylobacterium oxalidis TaxID=944322 RepID=A0A512IWF0_9HYPH|nr:hypothetical protein MOX02_00540 [Methylobacterium oxalidis]GLS61961.1 hypothetical protein GCM10007888_03420 [Methylobacterium oxalidis]
MRAEHRILDVAALEHLGEGVPHQFRHALLALRGTGALLFLGHRVVQRGSRGEGCNGCRDRPPAANPIGACDRDRSLHLPNIAGAWVASGPSSAALA